MNIEELKVVMEAIRGMSGDAASAFSYWCAFRYIPDILEPLFRLGMVLGVCWTVYRIVTMLGSNIAEYARIERALGLGEYQSLLPTQKERLTALIEREKSYILNG